MRLPLLVLFLLGPALLLGADELRLEEGFKRLDNGKDLEGWLNPSTSWSVVDGAIQANPFKAPKDRTREQNNLYHQSTHSRSCTIRLQFRALAKAADSGVYLQGRQFQVRDYPHANPNTQHYAEHYKPDDWNELEWDIREGVAVVKLNGAVIEKDWKIGPEEKKGLGLQCEYKIMEFRYIRIKETK